jgi:CheY-like chemotaxis protein
VTTADAEQALASGFQRHLSKPINFAALLETIVDLVKAESKT